MVCSRRAFPLLFFFVNYLLTFSFIFVWSSISNNQRINSTKVEQQQQKNQHKSKRAIQTLVWHIYIECFRRSFVLFIPRQPSVYLMFGTDFQEINAAEEKKQENQQQQNQQHLVSIISTLI